MRATGRRTLHERRHGRGAAVVTALLIVALATTVVAGLFVRENVTVRSVENRLALSQTHWIERAALDWAKVILRADARSGVVDHLGEPWAVPVAETRLDETVTAGAKISDTTPAATLFGQIIDAQSRLNLTSLVQGGKPVDEQLLAFRRLLSLVGLPESLADAVQARVRRSQASLVDGKPVPAVELPLMRLADLMSLPGFDAAAIEALAPFAIVLPAPTLVNVNTAPAEVLASVIQGLDLAGARRFVAQRERTFFRTLGDASGLLEGSPVLSPTMLSVGSGYFIVRGVVRFDRVEAATETLLARNTDRVEIVWQQRY
jgi:general secretion pathway protein K